MNEGDRHRLEWRSLNITRHDWRCSVCGAEPIVTLDEEQHPVLGCRTHRDAELEKA